MVAESILRIPLEDLKTIRIKCGACGLVTEGPFTEQIVVFVAGLFIPFARGRVHENIDTLPGVLKAVGLTLISTGLMAVYGAIAGAMVMGIASMLRGAKSDPAEFKE
jgi:hypothetical protein